MLILDSMSKKKQCEPIQKKGVFEASVTTWVDINMHFFENRAKLLQTTYAVVHGCWKPGLFRCQPLTNAAKHLMKACTGVPAYDAYVMSIEARIAAVRDAISRGAEINALYQMPLNRWTKTPGIYPLRIAALNCLVPIVRELLLVGADPNMISSGHREWPTRAVHPDLETDGVATVDMLLRAGASEEQLVEVIDKIRRLRGTKLVFFWLYSTRPE